MARIKSMEHAKCVREQRVWGEGDMDVNNRRDARGGIEGHLVNPVKEKGSRDRFWVVSAETTAEVLKGSVRRAESPS